MKISIRHLEDGNHRYEFSIEGSQLDFEYRRTYPGSITVLAEINKHSDTLQCKVNFSTTAHHICDRCLTDFTLTVADSFQLLFHLGEDHWESGEEDVIHLPEETLEFDLSEALIEHLILAIPMKLLCREDCEGICSGCGAELDKEDCRCGPAPIDPRWEKLRQLKNKIK